jgi:hypothetical protein
MPDDSAGAELAPHGPLYTFEVPGRPLSIVLEPAAAGQLLNEAMRGLGLVPRRGAEVGGILVGSVVRGARTVIRIEQVIPVPCEYAFGPNYLLSGNDKETFKRALAGVPAVGFFRTDTTGELTLQERDAALRDELFPDDPVALIVAPRILEASLARCFVWRNAEPLEAGKARIRPQPRQSRREASPQQAPQHRPPAKEASRLEPEPATPVPQPAEAAPDVPIPGFLFASETEGPPASSSPRWRSRAFRALLIAALLVVGGALGYFAALSLSGSAGTASRAQDPYSLSLVVLEYGENLHLSWNRKAAPIVAGGRGLLNIADGGTNRTLELTSAQLRNGSVTHHRLTDDVRLRLEIFVRDNVSVGETWVYQPRPADQ